MLAELPPALREVASLVMLQTGCEALCLAIGLDADCFVLARLQMPDAAFVNPYWATFRVLRPVGEDRGQRSLIRGGQAGNEAEGCNAAHNNKAGKSETPPPWAHVPYTMHSMRLFCFNLETSSSRSWSKQATILKPGQKGRITAGANRNVAFSC